uniref:Uncharacterized protein n=1 Tax=Arundo donax TaxID=35708 RepID=A0A0A9H982_ARUDO
MLIVQVILGASVTIVTASITTLTDHQGIYAIADMALRATLTYQMDARILMSAHIQIITLASLSV